MKKFLVIGNPIDHSLSPKLHNYWFKKYNINAIYGKLQTNDADLAELCENVRDGRLNGINVTVPFKKSIIPYVDVLSDHSLRTKSVNTISLENGIASSSKEIEFLSCSAMLNKLFAKANL